MNVPEGLAAREATGGRADPGEVHLRAVDPRAVNVDLHCHSRMSDGVLAPAELVRRARDNGVRIHALTDHDELGGLAEAACEAARGPGRTLHCASVRKEGPV